MKTDDLFAALAREPAPPPAAPAPRRLAFALVVGLLVAAFIVAAFLGVRPDIGAARMPVMMKAMFSALAASVTLPLLLRLSKPGRPLGWRVGAVLGFLALCAGVVAITLMGADPGAVRCGWAARSRGAWRSSRCLQPPRRCC
jgi:hypothetical protein